MGGGKMKKNAALSSIFAAAIFLLYLFGLYKACFDARYSAKEMAAAILIPPYTLIVGGYEFSRVLF
jgi:hypothetical protein